MLLYKLEYMREVGIAVHLITIGDKIWFNPYAAEVFVSIINPLSPHNKLKHNFSSLKNGLIS